MTAPRLAPLCAAAAILLTGCGEAQDVSENRLEAVIFDTVAIIGSLDGDEREIFGNITNVAVSERGEIAVLDLQARSVAVFTSNGEFTAAHAARGEGPGEFSQPWGLDWIDDGELLVLDRGNARISRFSVRGPELEYLGSMPMAFPMGHLCTLGERVYASAYRPEGTVHRFTWGDDHTDTFGPAPELESVERIEGVFRELARQQWAGGRLLCNEASNQVLEVGTLNGTARLFGADGATVWDQRLKSVHLLEPVVQNGAFSGQPNEVTGAHVAASVFSWDAEHVLLQYGLRFAEGEGVEDRPALESRLVHLASGREEARTTALPRLVGRSGTLFVGLESDPYPRLLLLERATGDGSPSAGPSMTSDPGQSP